MIGSLCSGYGGLDMAIGLPVSWHAENDKYVSKILDHHYPGVPNHGDIRGIDWGSVESVEWLTAGYPCQPFSLAGNRLGLLDPRHIWPDIAEGIRRLRPRKVFLENVRSHLGLGFDSVLGDLAKLGYDAAWCTVRASDAGAPHQRERLFILAVDSNAHRVSGHRGRDTGALGRFEFAVGGEAFPDSGGERIQGTDPADDQTSTAGQWTPSDDGGRTPVRLGPEFWGDYWPAVGYWGQTVGRSAPLPTELNHAGTGRRLSAEFTEWMMGLPQGHVTGVPGLAWTRQIKALGNGVVPQQARLALELLMEM